MVRTEGGGVNAPAIPCEKRLENEQRMHAEAFATVSASLDRVLVERDDARHDLALVRFRQKARAQLRRTA